MKHVLMIAWYFPPVGGPGTQRTSKYCKYLPRYGWQPIVFAGVDPSEHQDSSLLGDIPPELGVHRFGRPNTRWRRTRNWLFSHRLGRLGTHIGYWLDFPDTMGEWSETASNLAICLNQKHSFDVIYTTSYPYSAHLAGLRIKRELGLPWVADLRDPWAENQIMLGTLPGWMRRKHERAEKEVALSADIVITAHPLMTERFRQKHLLESERCLCITNGFDPDDYREFPLAPCIEDGMIRMVHTGSFYGDYNPQALCCAIEKFWEKPPDGVKQLNIRFVGGNGTTVFPKRPGLKIKTIPRVDHKEALKEQAQAHILLTVFNRITGASHVSGKIFEYLAARRPIFAVVPTEGSTAEIIRNCRAGWVVDCDHPESIVRVLHEVMVTVSQRAWTINSNKEEIAKYSRPKLAERLSKVLHLVSEHGT